MVNSLCPSMQPLAFPASLGRGLALVDHYRAEMPVEAQTKMVAQRDVPTDTYRTRTGIGALALQGVAEIQVHVAPKRSIQVDACVSRIEYGNSGPRCGLRQCAIVCEAEYQGPSPHP